jgi:hypothetical protein
MYKPVGWEEGGRERREGVGALVDRTRAKHIGRGKGRE